jgi:predicted NAD/FAD-dependent oxidoreductase
VPSPRRVAIVGAGVSGLACACTLLDSDVQVAVFDKARGTGGRTSTRRGDAITFDHGAQYFTARDGGFARHVEDWKRALVLATPAPQAATLSEARAARVPATLIARTESALAHALVEMERPREALALLDQAVPVLDDQLGATHPATEAAMSLRDRIAPRSGR